MIIMLSGWRRSGKDTCANIIKSIDPSFNQVSFASTLKEQASKEYNINIDYFYLDELKDSILRNMPVNADDKLSKSIVESLKNDLILNKENNIYYHTPRTLLIFYAFTKRFIDKDYFIKELNKSLKNNEFYVISDFRYKNEYFKLKELRKNKKLVTVRINRFDSINTEESSERDLDNFSFDYIIENRGNKSDLVEKVKEMMVRSAYEQE